MRRWNMRLWTVSIKAPNGEMYALTAPLSKAYAHHKGKELAKLLKRTVYIKEVHL